MEHIGVGLRAVATIIDTLLLMVIAYLIALLTGATTASGFNLTGAPAFLWFFIAIAYYILMEGQFGATIGKKLVGLKVVKVDGQALNWQAAIVRNVLRIVDGFLFYLVGAVIVWSSKNKQRLGDIVAHTAVIRASKT